MKTTTINWTDGYDMKIEDYPATHPWWHDWLTNEMTQPYFGDISKNIKSSHEGLEDIREIFPPKSQVFRVFEQPQPSVVIIGQDPYHTPGNAMGLAFSVPRDQKRPQSLLTIYKELKRDPNVQFDTIPNHGDLSSWSSQSVMLLNSALTVRESNAGSHLAVGWKKFTDRVVERVSKEGKSGTVFLLWGNYAHPYEKLIDTTRHHVLKAGHPSPLNTTHPFVGCGHFSKANDLLIKSGYPAIQWNSIN
jgi:uracil-DNA glycosylase